MFKQCLLRHNPYMSENFVTSLRSTKREHRTNMGQHRIILKQLLNNNYDSERKYFKRPQMLYDGVPHPT